MPGRKQVPTTQRLPRPQRNCSRPGVRLTRRQRLASPGTPVLRQSDPHGQARPSPGGAEGGPGAHRPCLSHGGSAGHRHLTSTDVAVPLGTGGKSSGSAVCPSRLRGLAVPQKKDVPSAPKGRLSPSVGREASSVPPTFGNKNLWVQSRHPSLVPSRRLPQGPQDGPGRKAARRRRGPPAFPKLGGLWGALAAASPHLQALCPAPGL